MVEFTDLWRGHPINHSVAAPCIAPRDLVNMEGTHIRTGLPVFSNQCAIRMGIALKRAGVTPNQLPRMTTCGIHPPEEMHYIRAEELGSGLAAAKLPGVGPMEKITGANVSHFYPQIFGRTGMLYIQDYWFRGSDGDRPTGDHIDVWNGYRSSAKWLMEWFSWLGYYSNYAGAREMWFWEVK